MISENSCCHDFVAIDIEYADSIQHICQFGLVVVRNLEIVDRRSWYIRPPGNRYESNMTSIHGITPEVTADEPSFEQVWPEIYEYLRDEHLWAHNAASVEQPVINKNIRFCEQDFETIRWINDSRELYPRPDCPQGGGNGLVQCCMAMGLPYENHHDALADAEMCARLVIGAIKERKPVWDGVPLTMEDLHKSLQGKRVLHLGEFRRYYESSPSGEEDVFCEMASTCDGAAMQRIDVYDKGDKIKGGKNIGLDFSRLDKGEGNPLYGKKVVVTGLFDIERKEIEAAVEMMGAKRQSKPVRNTDVVILGIRNVGFTKLCAIEELQDSGHSLVLVVGNEDLQALLYGDGQKFFR